MNPVNSDLATIVSRRRSRTYWRKRANRTLMAQTEEVPSVDTTSPNLPSNMFSLGKHHVSTDLEQSSSERDNPHDNYGLTDMIDSPPLDEGAGVVFNSIRGIAPFSQIDPATLMQIVIVNPFAYLMDWKNQPVFYMNTPSDITFDNDTKRYLIDEGYGGYLSSKNHQTRMLLLIMVSDDPNILIEKITDGGRTIANLKVNDQSPDVMSISASKQLNDIFYSGGRDVDGEDYATRFPSAPKPKSPTKRIDLSS